MSKIRIYELAKELGVDNKVVIQRAAELGMSGKASHSNTLESDEADQIRRAVIRQAMGAPQAPAPAADRITTRVDKVTGVADTVVESRKGNVIRRRRADTPGASAGEGELHVSMEAESAQEQMRAEYIDDVVMPEEPADDEVSNDVAVEEHDVIPDEEQVGSAEVVDAPEDEAVEPAPDEEEVVEAPREPAAVAATPVASPAAAVVAKQVEVKRPIGPRVLGRIELPVRKPIVAKPEAKKGVSFGQAAPVIEEEEDDKKGKPGQKKRTKKRELSRGDLVDYSGRDVRRTGRPGSRRDSLPDRRMQQQNLDATKTKASKRVVTMDEAITVGELAKQLSVKAGEVIAKLIELGVMATINQALDQDTATLIAEDFGFQIESSSFDESVAISDEVQDDPSKLQFRPPVVTVMGHVDHGKTTLLDSIRNASVAAREHGGITQHIGAYGVALPDGRSITFIDTPGHAAFTAMRARGAKVTDMVILVVAADDGVMPQTVEAINHAKAAEVPIVVAVNKMDKHDANPDRVKQQLLEHGLQPEDWGGDTMFFNVSATKGQGVKELLEGLLLQAEVKELRANPDRRAQGTIVEVRQERGRGTVATVLVQNGTLKIGDVFVSGAESGRIRSMTSDTGTRIESAGPSIPVEITGIDGVPEAGDDFSVVETEMEAREIASNRKEKKQAKEVRSAAGPISLEEFSKRANSMVAAELNVILKADVQGSLEAVRQALEKLITEKVKVKVIHGGVGGITESDVQLAIASKAIIIGFGVRADPRVSQEAEIHGVELRFYRIIYELIDEVKLSMAGLLDPIKKEVPLARVEVRQTFQVPKGGTIAGSFVVSGTVKRGAFARLLRDGRVIHEGKVSSLRRIKDDVREVASGYECGIGIENYNDVKTGDIIEVYEFTEVAATLE